MCENYRPTFAALLLPGACAVFGLRLVRTSFESTVETCVQPELCIYLITSMMIQLNRKLTLHLTRLVVFCNEEGKSNIHTERI